MTGRRTSRPCWRSSAKGRSRASAVTKPGATAKVDLEFTSPNDANIGGAFLGIELPAAVFSGGSVQLVDPDSPTAERTSLAPGLAEQNVYVRAMAKGVK